MTPLQKHYGPTEGPLGFPLTDKQAFALETILKALPRDSAFNYRKAVLDLGPTEISPHHPPPVVRGPSSITSADSIVPAIPHDGQRTIDHGQMRYDVSWISTEDPDRMGEVVIAKGMSDGQFRLNPIVTLNHCYDLPPVGKSLWRKVVKDGDLRGIKAKTQYPPRPADWKENKDWPADVAFALIQADLLRGKSIGFLPVKVHAPTTREVEDFKNRARSERANDTLQRVHGQAPAEAGHYQRVNLIIDEWILLEYACVFLPAQQNAVVESVSKGLVIPEQFQKALGIADDGGNANLLIGEGKNANREIGVPSSGSLIARKGFDPQSSIPHLRSFTRLSEMEKAILRQIEAMDLVHVCGLMKETVSSRLDVLRGRV